MCGIIGYAGKRNTAEVLLDGLQKLEYRGYDSAGIALMQKEGIRVYKNQGKVAALAAQLAEENTAGAQLGLGHTRWATHGEPSHVNSHPHRYGKVTLVHNGIIENERKIRKRLKQSGIQPISETDTELIAILMDCHYTGDPVQAIRKTAAQLEGSYALGILFEDQPGKIYAIRKDSPLIIGRGDGENFLASDIPAILRYTHDYWLLEEGELAILTEERVKFLSPKDQPIQKICRTADWDEQSAQKGGFAHFMEKEIAEQPSAVKETIRRYFQNGTLLAELEEDFTIRGTLRIVACGSAYHAGLMGKYAIEKLARLPVTVEVASEFRYGDPILSEEDLVLIISQSGETADSLAALRLAKERGIPTMGIVNVWGSSLAREADTVLYTAAGPEISVATTKAYTCQVTLLYLLALRLAKLHLSPDAYHEYCTQIEKLPHWISQALLQEENCKKIAGHYRQAEHLFFIGRSQDYHLSMEASLKLKEISYIHSEAYAAGELKHGTISLIEKGTPVVAVITDRERFSKTAANIREVRARGAAVLCITYEDTDTTNLADQRLTLPSCPDFLAPIPGAVITQLFAYHMAVARGNDVDQPRNLAKSVTVE